MNGLKDFLEIFKLPPSILGAISIATGIIIFIPDDIAEKMYILDFRNKFGFVISILFIISITMLIILVFVKLFKMVKNKYTDNKIKKNKIKYLLDLDEHKANIIKMFLEDDNHTVALSANSGSTIELVNYGVITLAGNTQYTDFNMNLKYFLQPWVIKLIVDNKDLKEKYNIK